MTRPAQVTVVGAGFAGLACAQACAARGLVTEVLERKADPGLAVRTTGLLVKEVADEWDVPRALTRKIRGVRLYAPSLEAIDLESPGYFFLATDTPAVLRWLASKAAEAGARIRLGCPWPAEHHEGYLVGADGPRSPVARAHGLGVNREFLVGVEGHYEGVRDLDPDRLHCLLDPHLAPGYLAWAFAGVRSVQVGLACRGPRRPDLDACVRRFARVFDFSRARQIEVRGGLIPVGGTVRPFAAEGILLVGDAAGLVSPLTAGGIHTALRFGRQAGIAVAGHLLDGGPPPSRAMAGLYPRFSWKKLLRKLIDLGPPARAIDLAFSSPLFRGLAQTIFFHHRGLFEPEAWREFARVPGDGGP